MTACISCHFLLVWTLQTLALIDGVHLMASRFVQGSAPSIKGW